jgi:hypothetical protein
MYELLQPAWPKTHANPTPTGSPGTTPAQLGAFNQQVNANSAGSDQYVHQMKFVALTGR